MFFGVAEIHYGLFSVNFGLMGLVVFHVMAVYLLFFCSVIGQCYGNFLI